jgi:transcriptional regulator with XRE-family HTH domain
MTVGAALGVSHSTVSRWETGAVPLTTKELEALAQLYGISQRQIEHSPESSYVIYFLDRAQHVIERLSAEDLERWIVIGERLSGREPENN